MPDVNPPSTPEARLSPPRVVSTVFSQSGAGWPASKDEANSRSAFFGAVGRATATPWEPDSAAQFPGQSQPASGAADMPASRGAARPADEPGRVGAGDAL